MTMTTRLRRDTSPRVRNCCPRSGPQEATPQEQAKVIPEESEERTEHPDPDASSQ